MYLLFDTETTGLPKSWSAPVDDLNNWPRIVQIAWQEFDKHGKVVSKGDYIIKPNDYTIPEDSARIHKISTQRAIDEGEDLNAILKVFSALVDKSEYLVAHNLSFDLNVLGAEFKREYIQNSLLEKKQICTMKQSIEFCKIPGKKNYKFPRLSELYRILFGEAFKEAHNAAADIEATARCFWELKNKDLFDKTDEIKEKTIIPKNDEGELSLF